MRTGAWQNGKYRKNGAMAQYIAVKARTLYALPPTVSFEQGCLVEPFAVGMHAVLRSGLAAGQTAAVIGDGTIGLMTLIAAKKSGRTGLHKRPPRPDHRLPAAALHHRADRCAVQLFLRRGVPGLPAGHCRGSRRPDRPVAELSAGRGCAGVRPPCAPGRKPDQSRPDPVSSCLHTSFSSSFR